MSRTLVLALALFIAPAASLAAQRSAEDARIIDGYRLTMPVLRKLLPALKATGQRVQASLQQLSTRGSQQQLGRTWTALIVVQVAIAVAVLPFALHTAGKSVMFGITRSGYPADEILRASLSLEGERSPPDVDAAVSARALEARFLDRASELIRRLGIRK